MVRSGLRNNVGMPGFTSAAIRVSTDPPHALETDLLVIPVFENDPATASRASMQPPAASGRARGRHAEITGKLFETSIVPVRDGWAARRVLLLGAGPPAGFSHETAGRLAGGIGLLARQRHITRIGMLVRAPTTPRTPRSRSIASCRRPRKASSSVSCSTRRTSRRWSRPAALERAQIVVPW